LRARLLRDNGGEVDVPNYPGGDIAWQLHPVWDPGERTRAKRTTNHVVRETEEHRHALPDGSVVIAGNGTGDLLILMPGTDQPHWWDHETTQAHPVDIVWS
jgi:hypothetical protein